MVNTKLIKIHQVVQLIILVITCSLVFARIYLRVIRDKRRAAEEWFIIFAAHLCLETLPKAFVPKYFAELRVLYQIGPWFYFGAIGAARMAIILFHVQLTEGFWVNKVARFMVWIIAAFWIVQFATYILGCTAEKRLSLSLTDGCPPLNESWDFWCSAALNIMADLILFVIPYPAITKITNRHLRLAVGGVYTLGIISIITSIARVVLLLVEPDKLANTITMQTAVETSLHVVVATIPGISGSFVKKYVTMKTKHARNDARSKAVPAPGAPNTYGGSTSTAGVEQRKPNRQHKVLVVRVDEVDDGDIELGEGRGGGR
ncbi:hypothetical protein MKZ38_003555 [Zalerion maritima]|uniref:Rhodopsin domain-containing protein n=1 Tax=Zalerion maritima TaxID=339359 RepID=A0AAD5RMM6_9PEZI|nr:hypothetical protein MKZ38_003555 [Zalerion maritima]